MSRFSLVLKGCHLCVLFLIDFKSLFIEKEIAHDSQGTLYKATWKKHHQPIAVKRLYHPGRASEDLLLDTIHEASCLSIVEHSNVVVFLGVCLHQNDVYVVTEFLPTRLSDLILESPVRSMESRVDMLCGAAKGLAHLHSLGIACGGCGSIKSDNIFLDVSDQDLCRSVKIGGFGFERIKREGAVTSFCDSFAWTPPCQSQEDGCFLVWRHHVAARSLDHALFHHFSFKQKASCRCLFFCLQS
jgi:serine/threonine protein kinase